MPEPVERWSAGEKALTYVVELEGREVQKTFSHWGGPTVRRYVVDRVEVTTRWAIGREEEGRTVVKLDCRDIIGGRASFRSVVLYPEDLDEVPPWLADLETRASPRDVG